MAIASGLWQATLAALAFGVASPASAAPKITPSKPFEIGSFTTARVRGVVGLPKGGAMFAFSEGQDVLVRAVDAKGKLKSPVSLTFAGQSQFGIPEAKLAALSNGNIAAAWIGQPGGVSTTLLRVVRPDGASASGEITASVDESNFRSDVSVAALSGGAFVVAWLDNSFEGDETVRARVFDASAQPLGSSVTLKPPSGAFYSSPYVARLGKGFVLVHASVGAVEGVYGQIFSATGKASGKPFRLDAPNDLTHQTPVVTALDSGGAAVVWRENDITTAGSLPIVVDTKLKGVFLDKKGKAKKRFALDDPIRERSLERALSITETDDGLLVAWSLNTVDVDYDVRGALVSPSGKTGATTTLTKSNKSAESGPRVALTKDGRVAFGYSAGEREGDDGPFGAFGSYLKIQGK